MKSKFNTAFKYLSTYAIVNIVYILIILLFRFVFYRGMIELVPSISGTLMISVFIYLYSLLILWHILYFGVYSVVFTLKFIMDKSPRNLVFTLIISVLGLFLNIWFWQNGGIIIN